MKNMLTAGMRGYDHYIFVAAIYGFLNLFFLIAYGYKCPVPRVNV